MKLTLSAKRWRLDDRLSWSISLGAPGCLFAAHARCGDAPHNFAILWRIALNLLKGDTKTKLGIANKRLKTGWDVFYLSQLLGL